MRKTQLFFVHGGHTFRSRDDYVDYLKTKDVSIEEKKGWNGEFLKTGLGEKVHIIKPRMPMADDAKYNEWKIYFERFFDLLEDDIILIGESLGGIFFSKYLSENKFPKKIKSVYLVAPPFDNEDAGDEELLEGFELGENLSMILENCKNVNLLFSKDDDCVPVSHAEKYKAKLPGANIIIYESKNGHFQIEEFPEIVEMIKKDLRTLS